MSSRCERCCQMREECRCITTKGRMTCFRCSGLFKVGDQYRSPAPGVVYHLGCYVADVKEGK